MEFSLDNPGFSESIASVQDAPKSSGSSSTSSGQQQRSCAKCPSRMSSIDRDKHLICIKCRGYECSVELRCEECEGWSKEEMLSHEKMVNRQHQSLRAGENLLLNLLRSLLLLLRPVPLWT